MRIHLEALGCRLNEAELQLWARQFQALGHQPSTGDAAADLVVVNTCAVTQEAVRKSRQLLRRVRRRNPMARLIVSGCTTALPDESIDRTGIDLIVPNSEKDRLVEIATRELGLPTMPAAADTDAESPLFARGRQRAFIKIQDGCRYQCTFCVTTIARGAERSRPVATIVEEIQEAARSGVQEAVLTGVHAAGYGADLGCRLEDLIAAVLRETDIPRLRLGSVEPWDLGDTFWTLFDHPRLAPHLHLPLQSGSDTVLRRMGRRCRTSAYRSLVARARDSIADFNLTTDIIVGFPGETDDDWRQTMALVEQVGFSHLHIFNYSQRAGTLAATMPDQVPGTVKRERAQALHELGIKLKQDAFRRYISRTLEVLFETGVAEASGEGPFGYSLNYLPVRVHPVPSPVRDHDIWVNQIRPVEISRISADGNALIGEFSDHQAPPDP